MTKFTQGNARAAKLSNEDVMDMRQKFFDEGWSQAKLARHYQVHINTVGRIVRGESRQRVPMMTETPEVISNRVWELQQQINREAEEKLKSAMLKDPAIKSQVEEDKFILWTKE
jgi:plasmid maintenance system antidote protein VapI